MPARQKGPAARKRKRSPSRESEDQSDSVSSPTGKKKVRWEGKPSAVTTAEETTGTESDSEEPAASDTICLAAYCQHGRVGFAYYNPIECMIYVLEDTQETAHFELTTILLEQASPDVLLTSSRSDDEFMDVARAHMDSSGGVFQIRPHKDFAASKGRERLLSLRLLSELPQDDSDLPASSDIVSTSSNSDTRNAYDFMRRRREVNGGDPTVKRWNASIRLSNFTSVESSPLCIASIGVLLDHLVRERAVSDLEDEGISGLQVRDIEALSLDHVMQINADALSSLQIFENESHASVHSDKTKEGLSLFGILNSTKTTLGRALLRTWLLRPSLSLPVIKARHDAVACFMSSENMVPAHAMHGHLKGIKNVPRILEIMRSGKAKMSDWQGLVKFTFHSAMLRDNLTELHQAAGVEIVKKLIAALDIASFRDVGNRINEIIDWEESANAGRVCVRPNIDEELDNRKHVYHGIDSVLSKVAEQVCQTVPPDYASALNIVYFPQLGFLICIPMLEEWKTPEGIKIIDGWSFQFSSEYVLKWFSQTPNVSQIPYMDVHIGDLHPSIVDREIEIVQELLEEIVVHFEAMAAACDTCAELDCLLSYAEASRAFDYRRPEMVDDNIIDIKQGRHPLQEQVVDTFVPNDAHLAGGSGNRSVVVGDESTNEAEEWNSVVLCTGANACGKSVYLKQVALIQYMAQIGCFVPAEAATLGVVDKIFTRISTRESVSKVQSAFMIDLNQVSLALRNSTARSLVLLDEFGKGTLSTGSYAFFWHLLNRGPNCPKVLAATHFHDVFKEDLLDPDAVPITFLHMQVMFTSSSGHILDAASPQHLAKPTLEPPPTGAWGPARRSRISTGKHPKRVLRTLMLIRAFCRVFLIYSVAEGLSLDSHAAKCAEIFGVPARIVQRAQHVRCVYDFAEMTDKERADLEDAEAVCRRFLQWNLEGDGGGNVKVRLAEVLGRKDEDDAPEE
ncbi:DNA mismatch repair protein MutS [Mycena rosella]|uniref:DNA mismatch repair protein MutS n=1 Tax=Mycena rosella TaxID=1033263 RepID=A0AAD7F9K6_MYCRO|nr:DNA mismatch repair protein MutS [Mycena rosella]